MVAASGRLRLYCFWGAGAGFTSLLFWSCRKALGSVSEAGNSREQKMPVVRPWWPPADVYVSTVFVLPAVDILLRCSGVATEPRNRREQYCFPCDHAGYQPAFTGLLLGRAGGRFAFLLFW